MVSLCSLCQPGIHYVNCASRYWDHGCTPPPPLTTGLRYLLICLSLFSFVQEFYLRVCMCACVCVPRQPDALRGQKTELDYLELESRMVVNHHRMVVNHHRGAGKRTVCSARANVLSPTPTSPAWLCTWSQACVQPCALLEHQKERFEVCF